jgi:hypothetical protein
VERHAAPRVCAQDAIGSPAIGAIEALRANVAFQDPQKSIAKSEFSEARTRRRYQRDANTAAPFLWIDIKGAQLSVVRQVRVARWRCSRKAEDLGPFDRQDGARLANVGCRKIVSRGAIFGTEPVEEFICRPVGRLPSVLKV